MHMNRSDVSINLLREPPSISQEEEYVFHKFRLFASFSLLIAIISGAIFSVIYFIFIGELNRLEEDRSLLARSINSQAKKELLLLSFQERAPIVQRIVDTQPSIKKIFGIIEEIIPPSSIKKLSFEEKSNQVNVTIFTNSFEEAEQIISRLMEKSKEGKIIALSTDSLSVTNDGKTEAVLTFNPTEK